MLPLSYHTYISSLILSTQSISVSYQQCHQHNQLTHPSTIYLPYQEIDQKSAHELAKHFADAVLPDESLSFAEHFNGDRHVDLFDSFSWRTMMILLENHYMTNFWITKASLSKSRALMYMGELPYSIYP